MKDGKELRGNALLAFRGIAPSRMASSTPASGAADRFVFDPATSTSFPGGMVLSELGGVRWSDDGARIFVGVKEQRDRVKAPEGGEPRANLEVWHWADERLQSVQKVRADADGRSTFLSVVNLEGNRRFVQLANDDMPRVQQAGDGRYAIGYVDKAYRMIFDEPGGLEDVVRIDMATGETKPIVQRIRFDQGASPNGQWFAWFQDGKVFAQNLTTGAKKDLSAAAGVDFTDVDADRPGEKPAWGIAGWSRDGRSILVNGKFDLWSIPLEGTGAAVNLTRGIGERDQIHFDVVSLDEDDADDGIDTSKLVLLSAYGEWTKKSGYWTVEPGKAPRALMYEDRMIGGVRKAEDADRVIFTAQTFEEYPDVWTSTTAFASPRRVTDANPQQKEYAWGRRVLVDYTDQRGNKLQATLTLPAGYVEGRRYPMLVYFYEKMSQNHHQYSSLVYDDRPHMSEYASDGYLVLMPDIVYNDGKPGSSALDDVT
jgi:dipeptidyl aminopeptidase/acylaminoacyl peptidase